MGDRKILKAFFSDGSTDTESERERERAGIHSVHSMTKPLQLIVTALLGIPQICREADLLAHRESLHRFTIRLSIRVTIHQHLQAEATKTSKVSNTHVFVKKSKKCACTSNIKLLAYHLPSTKFREFVSTVLDFELICAFFPLTAHLRGGRSLPQGLREERQVDLHVQHQRRCLTPSERR